MEVMPRTRSSGATLGLVDLHCHYLPGVDDGADNLRQGLALVHAAAVNGISRIVLTPHVHPGRYHNTATSLQVHFDAFERAVREQRLPVKLALAAEVRFSDELFIQVERGDIPLIHGLGGSRVMLLEFPHSHVPERWRLVVQWLVRRGITPMVAHPERNKDVMRNPQLAADMARAGCLLQVTAAALLGGFGERARQIAEALLREGFATIIATDAHNLNHRPPLLREGGEAAARLVGESKAWDMVASLPAIISNGLFDGSPQRRPQLDKTDPSGAGAMQ